MSQYLQVLHLSRSTINQQSYLCAQWRLRSACAFAQSEQGLNCPPEEGFGQWLFMKCTVKTLRRPVEWVFVRRKRHFVGFVVLRFICNLPVTFSSAIRYSICGNRSAFPVNQTSVRCWSISRMSHGSSSSLSWPRVASWECRSSRLSGARLSSPGCHSSHGNFLNSGCSFGWNSHHLASLSLCFATVKKLKTIHFNFATVMMIWFPSDLRVIINWAASS